MAFDPAEFPTLPRENEPARAAMISPETLALLAARRSTKPMLLAEPGPSEAQLNYLLRLAQRAPDHGKLGPWRFVIIAGEARARLGAALADVIAGDAGVDEIRLANERSRFAAAPVCIMVVSTAAPHAKIPEWEQILSAGAVCFQVEIAAHAMGFGSCWLTGWPCYDPRARAVLELQEGERIAGFISLGTATQAASERARPDMGARIGRY